MKLKEVDRLQTAFIAPIPVKPPSDRLIDMLEEKLTSIEIALIHIEEIMAGGRR